MDIKALLSEFQTIYPNMVIQDAEKSCATWTRHLSEFDDRVIRRAARRWMDINARFAPNLAEFRQLCIQMDAPKDPDTLRAEAYQLETDATQGNYDPDAWEDLAVLMDKSDRPNAAYRLRQKSVEYAKCYHVS